MPMNVVSKTRLRLFWAVHPDMEGPLTKWHAAVSCATWACFDDVRKTYNSADLVGDRIVFNVAGGCRVIVDVVYPARRVYIKDVFTHSEYDKWTASRRRRR
jgi:mRNA interferase HigB